MDLDPNRIDDAVLALLLLGLQDGDRVWKSFDWEAMNRLHERGFISNPVGKAHSVVLSAQGKEKAESLLNALFGIERRSSVNPFAAQVHRPLGTGLGVPRRDGE